MANVRVGFIGCGGIANGKHFPGMAQQEGCLLYTSLCLKALERIRRGAGLECAAAQERSACGLDALCNTADLRFAFDGARTRDERKGTVADHLTGRKLDDRIFRMELTVCFFIRLLHALNAFYNILCGDVLAVYRSGIADKAEHGGMRCV